MKYCTEKAVTLDCGGDSINDFLLKKINEPQMQDDNDAFFIGDLGDIINKYKIWKSLLPRVAPFYAVKCNDEKEVLQTLSQLGSGFDCASKAEIQKVLELGVSANRIIYANPCKQGSHIKYASKNKVRHMTFDNECELQKVKEIYPNARMVLRILPPQSNKVICPLGLKYGCHPEYAARLLRAAKQLNVQVVGVSFHVGSGCYDAKAYYAAIETAHKVFQLAEKEGFKFHILDIGGGFPGQEGAKICFSELACVVRQALDEFFPEAREVQLIAEPGRYFVASAFTLSVSIIATRKVADEEAGEEKFMHYMNDGVYGSFNCLLYDHAEIKPDLPCPSKYEGEPTFKTSLWGPTCDSLDCVMKECFLPKLQIKDWLIFRNMGAYTMASASLFNGMPKPAVYFFIQPSSREILKSAEDSKTAFALSSFEPNFEVFQSINDQSPLDICPLLLRAGHTLETNNIFESQEQVVKI